jgi:hypothetical protein
MPLVHVQGASKEDVRRFSEPFARVFGEVLGSKPEEVFLLWRDGAAYQGGRPVEGPILITVRWIRRSHEYFTRLVPLLMDVLRNELGVTRNVEIEIVEQWDQIALNGTLMSEWAKANSSPSRG